MAHPQEPQQPTPSQNMTNPYPQPYQPTDLRPMHQPQGHDTGGVGHFPVPATTTAAPTPTQSAPIPTQSDQYALGAWGAGLTDFTCPSGQRCALRKPQIDKLVQVGLLDKINVLAGIADGQVWASQGLPPIDVAKLMSDPAKFAALVDMLDTVIPIAVARPTILPAVDKEGQPIPEDKRQPGVGYPDFIDFADKVAIFEEYVSGIAAMGPFRSGAQQLGERMADGTSASLPTQPGIRNN